MLYPNAKPILYTAENRRKVIDGSKIQTRRVATNLIGGPFENKCNIRYNDKLHQWENYGAGGVWVKIKPRYQVGDIVYLQEPYQIEACAQGYFIGIYLDDGCKFKCITTNKTIDKWDDRRDPFSKTSARFMYKSLARHFRRIKGVRVERLQDISLEDIRAEGLVFEPECDGSIMRTTWKNLWNSINKSKGFGWESNPYNFVYVIERIE